MLWLGKKEGVHQLDNGAGPRQRGKRVNVDLLGFSTAERDDDAAARRQALGLLVGLDPAMVTYDTNLIHSASDPICTNQRYRVLQIPSSDGKLSSNEYLERSGTAREAPSDYQGALARRSLSIEANLMLTPNEARDIGRANAASAIDQVASYEGIEDAVDSYGLNALQTLGEMGVKDGDPVINQTVDAFLAVLTKHGITYKPHGM